MTGMDQVSIWLPPERLQYRPGDTLEGSIVLSPRQELVSSLRIVWSGHVCTRIGQLHDSCEYFKEVWSLKAVGTFVRGHTSESIDLKADKELGFPFKVKVPESADLPSSFEIRDESGEARVEYRLRVIMNDQEERPSAQVAVPILALPYNYMNATDQQTSEAIFRALVTDDSGTRRQYQPATKITVPCKAREQGDVIPFVAHIWHECPYRRKCGIAISLMRICSLTCRERTKVISDQVYAVHADVNLLMKRDYSVQTLSETLPIPMDAIPTVTIASGRLVTVEYKVCIQVLVHPHAIYKPLTIPGSSELGYMFVDTPILIDAAANAPTPRPPSYTPPEVVVEPTEEKRKKKLGMGSVFRRKNSSSSSQHQQQQDQKQAQTSTGTSSAKSASIRQVFSSFKPKSSRSSASLPSLPAKSAASSVTNVSTDDVKTTASSPPVSMHQQSEGQQSSTGNNGGPKTGSIIFFDMFPDSDSEDELEEVKADKRDPEPDGQQTGNGAEKDAATAPPLSDSDDDDEDDDSDLLNAMRKQEKRRTPNGHA